MTDRNHNCGKQAYLCKIKILLYNAIYYMLNIIILCKIKILFSKTKELQDLWKICGKQKFRDAKAIPP